MAPWRLAPLTVVVVLVQRVRLLDPPDHYWTVIGRPPPPLGLEVLPAGALVAPLATPQVAAQPPPAPRDRHG